jgi:hypothetical protein
MRTLSCTCDHVSAPATSHSAESGAPAVAEVRPYEPLHEPLQARGHQLHVSTCDYDSERTRQHPVPAESGASVRSREVACINRLNEPPQA